MYVAIALFAIVGFCSFAVDYGRVQLVKRELQTVADAAARRAAWELEEGVTDAIDAASAVAAANSAGGSPVELDEDQDIEFLLWTTPGNAVVLPPGARGAANAVRVTCRRTEARGNAVPLMLATVVGHRGRVDVTARATAMVVRQNVQAGAIGLDGISVNGEAYFDSYDHTVGPYPAGSSAGSIMSNGTIRLDGEPTITGNVLYGPGERLEIEGTPTIGGMVAPLEEPIVFPNNNPWPYAIVNDNRFIPSKFMKGSDFEMKGGDKLTLPAGDYYVDDFTMAGSSQLTFSGPATFWITGDMSMAGATNAGGNPSDVQFRVVGNGTVTLAGTTGYALDLRAPQSRVRIAGSPDIFGLVVGRTLEVYGTPSLHYDRSITLSNPAALRVAIVE